MRTWDVIEGSGTWQINQGINFGVRDLAFNNRWTYCETVKCTLSSTHCAMRALYWITGTVIVQVWQSILFEFSLFISRTTRTDFVQWPAAFTGGYVYKIDRLDTKRSFIGAAIEGPTHHLNEKKRSHPEGKLGGKWRGYYIGHPKKLTLTFDLAGLPLRSWSQSSPPTTTTTTTTTTPTVLWPVGR